MNVRNVRVKMFEETSAANLETAINTYLAGISDPSVAGSDREFVSIQYHMAHSVSEAAAYDNPAAGGSTLFNHTTKESKHCAMLVYTE